MAAGFLKSIYIAAFATAVLPAQTPYSSQAVSSVSFKIDGPAQAVEISNTVFEVTGNGIPGRPTQEKLLLRTTTRTREVVDEVGIEASTTLEAWPLGRDLTAPPLYKIVVAGTDARVMNNEIVGVERGLGDVEWWSIYSLGNGAHLFDTHVPIAQVSITKDVRTLRYVGFEVPEGEAGNVVGTLFYTSAEKVLTEAVITATDPKRARLLRSYFDVKRALSLTGTGARLSLGTVVIPVPLRGDALDIARAIIPAGLRIQKR